VIEYLESWSSAGLAEGGDIEVEGAEEVRFKVVE
jgi:hypothetical protein